MKLIDKIFGKKTEKKSVPMSFFYNSGIMANIITRGDALDFYKSWVYACVSKRSMGIANIDFHLYKKQGEKVVEIFEHPILDLLYKVNPEMTKYNFFQLSCIYRDLLGASPWILEGGTKEGRNPKMIYIARPEFFRAEKNREGKVQKYVYKIGTYEKEFTPDQVIFLKNYNPQDPDKGIGLIEAIRMTAQNDDYIVQSNNNLLKNGAMPGGFIETEYDIEENEAKKITKDYRDKMGGYDNSFKLHILKGGMKFVPNLIPPRDLEFIEARKFNRDEIAGIFGVPKSLLTFDDVNLASAKTGEYQFAKWTLEPMATEIFEQLNEFLVPKFDGGENLWLDFEPLAIADEELEIKKNEASFNKWKTTNEIRDDLGLAPLDGGDYIYLPFSSIPMMNSKGEKQDNVLKIGSGRAMESRLSLKKENYIKKRILNRNYKSRAMAKKIAERAFKRIEDKTVKSFKIVEKKQLSDEQINAFYKSRMAEEVELEKLWQDKFETFFKDQRKRFLGALKDSGKSMKKKLTNKGIARELGIDYEKELATTISLIEPLMYETAMRGVKQASELVGQPMVADLNFLEEWIGKVSEETGTSITNTTIEGFEKTLREGVEQGESLGDLTKRVEEVFDFATKNRAEMIARTETARGVTEAHRLAYDQFGYSEVKWLLAPDACDECIAKEMNSWTVDSIKGEIPVHPQCKCDFTPIFKR